MTITKGMGQSHVTPDLSIENKLLREMINRLYWNSIPDIAASTGEDPLIRLYTEAIGTLQAIELSRRDAIASLKRETVRTGKLAMQVGNLHTMLKQLEWSQAYLERGPTGSRGCPICERSQNRGHTPKCKLAVLLKDLSQ